MHLAVEKVYLAFLLARLPASFVASCSLASAPPRCGRGALEPSRLDSSPAPCVFSFASPRRRRVRRAHHARFLASCLCPSRARREKKCAPPKNGKRDKEVKRKAEIICALIISMEKVSEISFGVNAGLLWEVNVLRSQDKSEREAVPERTPRTSARQPSASTKATTVLPFRCIVSCEKQKKRRRTTSERRSERKRSEKEEEEEEPNAECCESLFGRPRE